MDSENPTKSDVPHWNWMHRLSIHDAACSHLFYLHSFLPHAWINSAVHISSTFRDALTSLLDTADGSTDPRRQRMSEHGYLHSYFGHRCDAAAGADVAPLVSLVRCRCYCWKPHATSRNTELSSLHIIKQNFVFHTAKSINIRVKTLEGSTKFDDLYVKDTLKRLVVCYLDSTQPTKLISLMMIHMTRRRLEFSMIWQGPFIYSIRKYKK